MENSVPLLVGLAALLILTIVMLLVWRVMRLRQGDMSKNMQYLNLAELRKRGILSDSEMKQVSTALSRQMERREEEEKRRQKARRADELVLDPEIRRMEIQAEAARLARLDGLGDSPDVQSPEGIDGSNPVGQAERGDFEAEDDLWEKLEDETDGEEEIEMPPDVVALYESGIITTEEFEAAKTKYRDQRKK